MTTFEVKASGDTIRAVAMALGRARLFDDRLGGSDEGRIAAWAEAAEPHHLSQEDMMASVTAYYAEESGKAMQVADLIRVGRRIRTDRGQREADDEREARQAQWDNVKAAPAETAGIAAAFVQGPVSNKTQRLTDAEFALQSCHGKKDSVAAIREYFAAKAEAQKGGKR